MERVSPIVIECTTTALATSPMIIEGRLRMVARKLVSGRVSRLSSFDGVVGRKIMRIVIS